MKAMARLTLIELKLFVREPLALIFVFAFPFFMLFILGGVFGNELTGDPEEARVWLGVGPADYYQPAYIGLVLGSIGLITMPLRIATYRERGVFRRFRAAGVSMMAILGSQLIVGVGMAFVGGIGIVVASRLSQHTMMADSWLLSVGAYLLSAATFGMIGLMLGSILPGSRATQGAGLILFFVMLLISGSGPPREVLTSAMRGLSNILPLTHVTLLMQDTWIFGVWDTQASLVLAGFLVTAGGVTARFFRWE